MPGQRSGRSGVGREVRDRRLALKLVVEGPPLAEVDDRSRRVRSLRLSKRPDHDPGVRILVANRAKREPERRLHETRERRERLGRHLAHLGDRHRREAVLVEHALEQSDRLLADRSGGDEQHEVDGVREEFRGDPGASLCEQRLRVGDTVDRVAQT